MLGTLFSFSGRTGRLAYFGISLIQIVVLIFGFAVMIGLNPKGASVSPGGAFAGGLMLILAILLSVWIGLAAIVRRLRDMGWPIVIGLIAVLFLPFVSLVLLFWPGNGQRDYDVGVFSDDPQDPKPAKGAGWLKRPAKEPISADLAWMRPAPKPFVSAAPSQQTSAAPRQVAPNGARAQFGLRGQASY
jgi:uncharacterized membrane protein YhaH (DUF805 family)